MTLPAYPAFGYRTTTYTASITGTEIVRIEAINGTRIQEMIDSTTEVLEFFPSLRAVPNIIVYCMNIWRAESGFNLFHSMGNSRHNTVITGQKDYTLLEDIKNWKSGRDFYREYWNWYNIRSYRAASGINEGLLDGLYPHGISAVIGAYHIRGCRAYETVFGEATLYHQLAVTNNLIVNAGGRVTDLYTDDVAGRKKSILAGVIILDSKFQYYISKNIDVFMHKHLSDAGEYSKVGDKVTQRQAMLLAIGAYVGWAGMDANKYTAAQRVKYVRDNSEWLYMANNKGTRIASSTGGTPSNIPGCSA